MSVPAIQVKVASVFPTLDRSIKKKTQGNFHSLPWVFPRGEPIGEHRYVRGAGYIAVLGAKLPGCSDSGHLPMGTRQHQRLQQRYLTPKEPRHFSDVQTTSPFLTVLQGSVWVSALGYLHCIMPELPMQESSRHCNAIRHHAQWCCTGRRLGVLWAL